VVIRRSRSGEIDALVAELQSAIERQREAAVARLTVAGARAVERVIGVAVSTTASAAGRRAAFRVLEAIADRRALTPALAALADPEPDVAAAAIATARAFLSDKDSGIVVDRLAEAALDRARHRSVRVAAIRALSGLNASTIKPLLAALVHDPDAAVRDAAAAAPAADGGTAEDAASTRQSIAASGATMPLPALLRTIEHAREHEAADGHRSAEWTVVRGAAHVALARRGSRLGVYDLRESFETAAVPLPADFFSAVITLADPSCLEALAAAYQASAIQSAAGPRPGRGHDDEWRQQLADAFLQIAAKRRLNRRSAVVKRIAKRWPGVVDAMWAPRQ